MMQNSVRVHCDSQNTIQLTKNHRYKRTKHIDATYHKLRQWVVDDKMIDLVKISAKKNLADMMTKTISVENQSISELHQDSPKVRWKTGS